jgi:hypothetical protein
MKPLFLLPFALLAAFKPAVDPPKADISNGIIKAQLLLPDAQNGYYRGTRFDWAGQVSSLTYKGHSFVGNWNDRPYDPKLHDAIMGPVEEFGVLGFADAKPGETFVQIGVGALTRTDDKLHNRFGYYPIADHGRWRVKTKANRVEFRHTLNDPAFPYDYQKTLELVKGKPELLITHTLKNTGKRVIETTSYNHNFYQIDAQPTGPTYAITFPTDNLSAEGGLGVGNVVNLSRNQLIYLKEQGKGDSVFFPNLTNNQPAPYRLTIENTKTRAGIRISGDREIARLLYWSHPNTVCPEPYVNIRIEPGQSFSWQIRYEFFGE